MRWAPCPSSRFTYLLVRTRILADKRFCDSFHSTFFLCLVPFFTEEQKSNGCLARLASPFSVSFRFPSLSFGEVEPLGTFAILRFTLSCFSLDLRLRRRWLSKVFPLSIDAHTHTHTAALCSFFFFPFRFPFFSFSGAKWLHWLQSEWSRRRLICCHTPKGKEHKEKPLNKTHI